MSKFDQHKMEKGMALILEGLGCDRSDENFTHTPERYARAMIEMFQPEQTEWATFTERYNEFVLLRNHQIWSLCPHHMLPVLYKVSIAYIPNGQVLGISKLARLLDEINDGPILQEKLTHDVVKRLLEICPSALGAACLITGKHMCMSMRGVKSVGDLVTDHVTGIFKRESLLAERFFRLVGDQRV